MIGQGEVAVQFYLDENGEVVLENMWTPTTGESFEQDDLRDLYLSQSLLNAEVEEKEILSSYLTSSYGIKNHEKTSSEEKEKVDTFTQSLKGRVFEAPEWNTAAEKVEAFKNGEIRSVNVGKKYKPVHLKVKPTYTDLPDKFRIVRDIKGDPLAELPVLPDDPPPFVPTGRYTQERMEEFEKVHDLDFLRRKEMDLIHHTVAVHDKAFAWDDSERGSFRQDFFPPVEIPTVPHKPWTERSIKIPPGIYNEVCKIIKTKLSAGVYEPSNSSYRSRWFTVLKKGGKLRIVHSLEPLNAVTIAHSGLPPATEEIAAHFAGRACGGMLDLYVGYDERPLAESSRDLTTFQTPFGALRLVTLPMGWTNSVPIFHDDVTFILKDEIPHVTIPYIDDVGIRGPATRYELPGGGYEVVKGHDPETGIRRFVWEHMQNVNRVLQHIKYSHATFSGYKSVLCADEITVVGHRCTYEGRKPSTDRVGVIERWGPCKDVSDVRAFLGTVGVLRNFIKDFAKIGQPIQKLTRSEESWVWGPDQDEAQARLIEAVKTCPALKPINPEWPTPVVLAVDTSWKAVGFYIYQVDPDDDTKKNYARFDSITLNSREARFSQPKRELYGLRRALDSCSYWLFGVRNLVVETDAKYIKGMLTHPSLGPNATINRWIDDILLFHFKLVHKAGRTFGPDGLSRRDAMPGDPVHPNPEEGLDEPEGPLEFINPYDGVDDPLDFDDFKYDIDTRGGYFHGIATCIADFEDDLVTAREDTLQFVDKIKEHLSSGRLGKGREEFFQQLINTSVIPELEMRYDPDVEEPYIETHRSATSKLQDEKVPLIKEWLKNPDKRPEGLNDKQYDRFVRQASGFFVDEEGRLYRRGVDAEHKLVVDKSHRMYMMRASHDSLGHRGFYATKELIGRRFWWPEYERDVSWYVKSCKLCQDRQKMLLRIPATITHTPSIFQILHADTMHMTPKSAGRECIVHGRCGLSSWMEGRPLKSENAKAIAQWLFEDIICRWGCLVEIVTDNGKPFIGALEYLKKWGIKGIRISAYNKQAQGKVERPHGDIRQSLYKATEGFISKWFYFFHHVMWADRITVRRGTGCSPFFMTTGAHPILPLDIIEATWLVKLPDRVLTTEELIGYRARALAKHADHVEQMRARITKEKRTRLLKYEEEHRATIKDYNFAPGSLVLVRNTQIEDNLDRKMYPRYLGPMIVIRRNKGGAYILCEMNGAVWQEKVGAFRVVPYFARRKIELPADIHKLIDISEKTLKALEDSTVSGERPDYKGKDLLFDKVRLRDPTDSDSDPEDSDNDSDEGDDVDVDAPRKLRSHKL